jgi:tryptophan synthase alpha chain
MNKIRKTILDKGSKVLNVYFTAGHPTLESTKDIILQLEKSGADLIEIGMPYSDPLADGLAIQKSSEQALKNGMNLDILFSQLAGIRSQVSVPLILMGYYNQMLQYGVEKFLAKASEGGISGFIIPDMPMDEYALKYQERFTSLGFSMSFLISPMTSEARIKQADELSSGFVYVVSQSSITGKTSEISDEQKAYFKKINEMKLQSPTLIGFGIHDKTTFENACQYANGAIVGSAFIRTIDANAEKDIIYNFIKSIIS